MGKVIISESFYLRNPRVGGRAGQAAGQGGEIWMDCRLRETVKKYDKGNQLNNSRFPLSCESYQGRLISVMFPRSVGCPCDTDTIGEE